MEKILILGVDSSTLNVLKACKDRNIYTIITDYLTPDRSPVKLLADEYWLINVTELDVLEAKCREEGIKAIYAGNHELCLDCAQALTKRMNLPFYASDYSWEISRDKALFKKLCRECGLETAKSYDMEKEIDPEVLKTIEYPVVVKPVDSSSARGFSIVYNEEDFYKAYDYAMQFSASKRVIVEEFLTGLEFQINGYSRGGVVKILTTMNVHYSEANGKNVMTCGAYFRMEDDDCFPADFKEKIVNFIKKQQIHDGMFFVQGIRHKGRACLTESAARLDGGGFWNVFSKMTEFDIIGDLVDFARGAESKIDFRTYDYSLRGKCYFEYGIVIRAGLIKEVIGIDEIRKDPEIQVIFNRMLPGAEIKASGDMGQIGCYINMTAKDRASLIEKVKFINDTVKVICDDGENHAIYFDKYDQLIACD